MQSNPSNCFSPQSLRVYDRAPVNLRSQTVQACVGQVCDISYDQCIICAEIDICRACLEDVSMCSVQGRQLMKRVVGCIFAPVKIEYQTGRNRVTACAQGTVSVPIDVLIRVPEVAPFDLRAVIDQAIVISGEYCGDGLFALRINMCAALFVVVESPCGCRCESCSTQRPCCDGAPWQSCGCSCPPQRPTPRPQENCCPPICPPVCQPPRQRPCRPPYPPVCRPVCPPARRPVPCLPLYPPERRDSCCR